MYTQTQSHTVICIYIHVHVYTCIHTEHMYYTVSLEIHVPVFKELLDYAQNQLLHLSLEIQVLKKQKNPLIYL